MKSTNIALVNSPKHGFEFPLQIGWENWCEPQLFRWSQRSKKQRNNKFNVQRILELCDEFVPGDPPEYFFDKNPENFSAILEVHRSATVLTKKEKVNLGDTIKFWFVQYDIPLLKLKVYGQSWNFKRGCLGMVSFTSRRMVVLLSYRFPNECVLMFN